MTLAYQPHIQRWQILTYIAYSTPLTHLRVLRERHHPFLSQKICMLSLARIPRTTIVNIDHE